MTIIESPEPPINMSAPVRDYLGGLRFGEIQSHRHISIVPLYHDPVEGAPHYVALADAIADGVLTVTEISERGSVPQVLVFNDGHEPVLIIDGEELIGAKQNRILNTSVLLKERSRTVVPVSCTEQRRWAYNSAEFAASNTVLERRIRSRNSRAVSRSLNDNASPHSDQHEVWRGILGLHYKAKFVSPTLALHQLVQAEAPRLNHCLADFPCAEGQVGLLVLVKGVVAGFDVIARPKVYAGLHKKLVRSYVLDALLDPPTVAEPADEALGLAGAFISILDTARKQVFPSVGYGRDHRYLASGLTGSALVHAGHLIHGTFLRVEGAASGSSVQH